MPVSESGAINLDKATGNLNNDSLGSYSKPKSIVDAVSEIQQYHVFEKQQESDIDSNFFTLRQVFDFFSIGFKSGFIESLLFVLLLPFFQTIYPSFKYYFLNEPFTDIEKYILLTISYAVVVLVTIWLTLLYRLYDGAITKKAIFSLLSGRSFAFLVKAVLVYFLFNYLYMMAIYDKEATYLFIDYIKFIFDWTLPTDYTYSTTDLYIYFYNFIVPAIKTTAEEAIKSMVIFASIPFLTVVMKGIWNIYQSEKSKFEYENY